MPDPQSPLFYLGRMVDAAGSVSPDMVRYDPADLTTHALVTGMTGSGKTGLCIGMLEEAALHGIPAIVIDVKGDLTNLLLHFPDLLPTDFEPWVDPDTARRQGKSVTQFADETAGRWRAGLAEWGLGREQLVALRDAADFRIFTPGSSAGELVNILASFAAPGLDWAGNEEVLRERIGSTVTALLALVGLENIDPLRSREHILLANLMEFAWKTARPLDLNELILQVQSPPFERLGAFPVNHFFPEKDRLALAMLLNNFLAAPAFGAWMEGQPLDVPMLLTAPDNRPRHSVFYLAHLNDKERMFFVTLLLAAVESWMRAQRGSSGLRAILYFDEIHGYLPPISNPPSRPVLLRLLKTARAFGLGLLLATQNPVDVDYKALSNAGTWLVGRLQTEQDKQRLLDGLTSVDPQGGRGLERGKVDKLISGLGKRVFLLHNVHAPAPLLLHTRWTLNYLAGPLTRAQLPALRALVGDIAAVTPPGGKVGALPAVDDTQPVRIVGVMPQSAAPGSGSRTRPAAPPHVAEWVISNDLGVGQAIAQAGWTAVGEMYPEGIIYRPALLAQAEVRYLQRRYNLDYTLRRAVLVSAPDNNRIDWEKHTRAPFDPARLGSTALPQTAFAPLPGWLTGARGLAALQKDFSEWIFRSGTLRVRANETLKCYGGPDISPAKFREDCAAAAREGLQADLAQLDDVFNAKLDALERKIARQQLEVQSADDEVDQRRWEEFSSAGELLLSIFTRRRRSLSYTLMKRRLTQQSRDDLKQERRELEQLEAQLEELQRARDAAALQAEDQWARTAAAVREIPVAPLKKDIYVELFGIAWLPFYQVRVTGELRELPGFGD